MPIQRWRCPVVLRVKAVVYAATGVMVALVFFPLWLAVPVAALLGVYGLAMAALGASVTLDTDAGLLRMRLGPVAQRVRLTNVAAVLVEANKVSIKRVNGWEYSLYAWGRGPLDRLLGGPSVAGDIGHAIAAAVALATAHAAAPGTGPEAPGTGPEAPGTGPAAAPSRERPAGQGHPPARSRPRLAIALLGANGVLAIGCALVVRVHWQNPALTVLGVIVALALGVAGLLYLLVALWILLTGRAPRGPLTS
jgi:hypothetical protein